MMYSILVSYGLRALLLSIVALLAQLAIKRCSASTRNVVAVASLLALLVLPLISANTATREVSAPAAIEKPIAYVAIPTFAVSDFTRATHSAPITALKAEAAANYGSTAIAILWLVIASLLILRLLVGFLRVRSWAKRSEVQFSKDVRMSAKVRVPMTVWAGRPLILLPTEAQEWDRERLAHVLGHEKAHIARRDLIWNFVGQIACALYWPLPTVWALQRISRDTSERSCDDKVLRSGIEPSDYAQDLLTIARDLSGAWPAAALPMAQKSEVASRIEHILNKKVRRGSAGVFALAATTAGSLALSLPVAVMGIRGIPQGAAVGPSAYGWASPGSWSATPGNGYVGTLPDGRKVQLLQVQRYNGRSFEAWKPDGTMIDSPTIYGRTYWMTKPNRLVLVTRFETKVTDDSINAGMGSGPYIEGEPVEQTFSGGGVLKATEPGWRTDVDYQEIDAPNMTRSSYTFNLCDSMFDVIGAVRPQAGGQIDVQTTSLKNVSFKDADEVQVPIPNPKGGWQMGADGKELERTAHGCSVNFLVPGRTVDDRSVKAIDKQGKAHESIWNVGGYVNGNPSEGDEERYYFELPATQVDRIEIATRKNQAVEILDVKLQPKPLPSP
jgi:beta-lactamase regulating signal transducer with metallopeptidase domain